MMDPLEYVKAVARRWKLVVACVLVAGIAGWLTADSTPRTEADPGTVFQSSVTLQPLGDNAASVNLGLTAYLVTQVDVATIAAATMQETGDPQILASQVSATADPETFTVIVQASDPDENRAQALATAFADAVLTFLRQSGQESRDELAVEAQQQVEEIRGRVTDLEQRIGDASTASERSLLQAERDAEVARYEIVYSRYRDLTSPLGTDVGLQPIGNPTTVEVSTGGFTAPRSRSGRMLFAGAVGLVLGLMLSLIVDRTDTRVRSRAQVQESFRMPVVAEIPRARAMARRRAVVVATDPGSVIAEAYRALRSAILLMAGSAHPARDQWSTEPARVDTPPGGTPRPPQVIAITSARPGEGKSTTVSNLGAALAETGRSVLVLDCDFRNPQVGRLLDAHTGVGLADLGDRAGRDLLSIARPTAVRNVRVISVNRPMENPTSVLVRIGEVIAAARTLADIVVIDCAPLLGGSDALEVLQHADVVLVACRAGRTGREQAYRATELLSRLTVPVVGVALIGVHGRQTLQLSGMRLSSEPVSWVRGARTAPRPPSRTTRRHDRRTADEQRLESLDSYHVNEPIARPLVEPIGEPDEWARRPGAD